MIRTIVGALLCATMLFSTSAKSAEKPEVDLLLVLASDVSRSVIEPRFKLQREGYMKAIRDPQVLKAIRAGYHQRIGVTFMEWSSSIDQYVLVSWSIISDEETAELFVAPLSQLPRSFNDKTAIGNGIDFAAELFGKAPFRAKRHVIDISGDGVSNDGRDVNLARDDAVGKDITINGLVILDLSRLHDGHMNPPGGLKNYYQNNVIGGSRSFVMEAKSHDDFANAIQQKLIVEIAMN